MERRKRERSRSPVDSREHQREKYPKDRDQDRHGRRDSNHKRDNAKNSLHDSGDREHKTRIDHRERDRREQRHERHDQPKREEYEERSTSRHGSNTDRYNDERNAHRRPGRDSSRERNTQRNNEERERYRRDRGRDFRGDQGNEQRGRGRPGYHGRQRDRRRESDDEPDDSSRYGQPAGQQGKTEAAVEAEKPNYGLSGKLTEYTNTYKGVVIKYNEPPEGRKPKTRWRLYPFKGEEGLPVLYIHRQSAYLLGRQRHIADIPIDHPSCSKQHAVLQYRLADYERTDGTTGRKVKPYIIDLESANGTFLNNQKIEPRRYYELKERDVLKFGFSSREYVILHEKSLNTAEEDRANTGEAAESGSDDSPE